MLFVIFTYLEIVVDVLSLYKTPNKHVCLSAVCLPPHMRLCSVPPRIGMSVSLVVKLYLASLLTLRLTNNVKFYFAKLSYLPSDFHTNTVISDPFALDPDLKLRGGRKRRRV